MSCARLSLAVIGLALGGALAAWASVPAPSAAGTASGADGALPYEQQISSVGTVLEQRPAPSQRPVARPFRAEGPLKGRWADADLRPKARPGHAFFRPEARPGDLLDPDPPPTLAGASDLLCLAVAVYHEARDQPLDGQLAVASVILNRASHPERWGRRPCDVVRPGQFSFFAPNGSYPPITEHEAWSIAVEMSREALERGPSTLVGQADHYYAKGASPTWDRGMVRVIRINDHIFFADLAVRS